MFTREEREYIMSPLFRSVVGKFAMIMSAIAVALLISAAIPITYEYMEPDGSTISEVEATLMIEETDLVAAQSVTDSYKDILRERYILSGVDEQDIYNFIVKTTPATAETGDVRHYVGTVELHTLHFGKFMRFGNVSFDDLLNTFSGATPEQGELISFELTLFREGDIAGQSDLTQDMTSM